MALNKYLVRGTVGGALGGLLFGFDTAVISGTTAQLRQVFALTDATLGVTVSIALAGTVVGAATSGVLGQRMGGRGALRIMAVLYLASALGCAFARDWTALPDMGGLFERVAKLQYAPVVVMPANDLHADRKAARRECAGRRG